MKKFVNDIVDLANAKGEDIKEVLEGYYENGLFEDYILEADYYGLFEGLDLSSFDAEAFFKNEAGDLLKVYPHLSDELIWIEEAFVKLCKSNGNAWLEREDFQKGIMWYYRDTNRTEEEDIKYHSYINHNNAMDFLVVRVCEKLFKQEVKEWLDNM